MTIKVIEVRNMPEVWSNNPRKKHHNRKDKRHVTVPEGLKDDDEDANAEAQAFKSYLDRELEVFRNRH